MRNYFEQSWTESRRRDFVETGKANAFLRQVYAVMALGLLITGLAAWYVGMMNDGLFNAIFSTPLRWVVMFAPLGFILALNFGLHRMSYTTVNVLFATFSAVMGMSLAYIFRVYSLGSIMQTFFITAGTFGAMSLVGMTTKVDLSRYSSFLYMGLIGLIIASLVNLFMQSGTFDYIISFIGVALFCGLTAYDTQRLMQLGAHADTEDETVRKAVVMGALALYLDFINLFLFLLRFFGGGND